MGGAVIDNLMDTGLSFQAFLLFVLRPSPLFLAKLVSSNGLCHWRFSFFAYPSPLTILPTLLYISKPIHQSRSNPCPIFSQKFD